MKNYFITVRSVTYAQRGEQILSRRGYRCWVQRTPRWMEEQGCGYCLKVRSMEISGAAQILLDAGVPIRKVYAQRQDGQLEELTV